MSPPPSRPRTPEPLHLEDLDPDVPPPPPPTPYTAFPKPRATLPDEGHFQVSSTNWTCAAFCIGESNDKMLIFSGIRQRELKYWEGAEMDARILIY